MGESGPLGTVPRGEFLRSAAPMSGKACRPAGVGPPPNEGMGGPTS